MNLKYLKSLSTTLIIIAIFLFLFLAWNDFLMQTNLIIFLVGVALIIISIDIKLIIKKNKLIEELKDDEEPVEVVDE